MAKITVFGGTGYAGASIVAEAAARGHAVTAVSRTAPAEPVAGVEYLQGSVDDAALVATAGAGADAVVAALSPRGDMAGRVLPLYQALAAAAAEAGTRLIVVGGFNGLRPAAGAPRFAASLTDDFPFKDEALELVAVLDWLQAEAPEGLAWTFVSPAALFGGYAPGERTGTYRIGGEVSLNGVDTVLGGADFGIAIVDLIESGDHAAAEHIGIAY